MDDDFMQTDALVLVLFGGIVSWGCSSDRAVSGAGSMKPSATGGRGARRASDVVPEPGGIDASPDCASPVH